MTASVPGPPQPLAPAPQESLQASAGPSIDHLAAAQDAVGAIAADLAGESPTKSAQEHGMSPLVLQFPKRPSEIAAAAPEAEQPQPTATSPLANRVPLPILPPITGIMPRLTPEKMRAAGLTLTPKKPEKEAGASRDDGSDFHSSDIKQLPITQPIPYGGTPPDAGDPRPSTASAEEEHGQGQREGGGGSEGTSQLGLGGAGAKSADAGGKTRVGGWLGPINAWGMKLLKRGTPGSASAEAPRGNGSQQGQPTSLDKKEQPSQQGEVQAQPIHESPALSVLVREVGKMPAPAPRVAVFGQPAAPAFGFDALLPTQPIPATQAIEEPEQELEEKEEEEEEIMLEQQQEEEEEVEDLGDAAADLSFGSGGHDNSFLGGAQQDQDQLQNQYVAVETEVPVGDLVDEILEDGDRDDDVMAIEEIIEEVIMLDDDEDDQIEPTAEGGNRVDNEIALLDEGVQEATEEGIEEEEESEEEEEDVSEIQEQVESEFIMEEGEMGGDGLGEVGGITAVDAGDEEKEAEEVQIQGEEEFLPAAAEIINADQDIGAEAEVQAKAPPGIAAAAFSAGNPSPAAGGVVRYSPRDPRLRQDQHLATSIDARLDVGGIDSPGAGAGEAAASPMRRALNFDQPSSVEAILQDEVGDVAMGADREVRQGGGGRRVVPRAAASSVAQNGNNNNNNINNAAGNNNDFAKRLGWGAGPMCLGGGPLTQDFNAIFTQEDNYGPIDGGGGQGDATLGDGDDDGDLPASHIGAGAGGANAGVNLYGTAPVVDESPKPANPDERGERDAQGESQQPAEASRGPGNATLRGRALSREGLAQTQPREYTMQDQEEGIDVQTSPVRTVAGPKGSSYRRPRDEPAPLPGVTGMEFTKKRKLNPTRINGNAIAAQVAQSLGRQSGQSAGAGAGVPAREPMPQHAQQHGGDHGTANGGGTARVPQEQQRRRLPPFPHLVPMGSREAAETVELELQGPPGSAAVGGSRIGLPRVPVRTNAGGGGGHGVGSFLPGRKAPHAQQAAALTPENQIPKRTLAARERLQQMREQRSPMQQNHSNGDGQRPGAAALPTAAGSALGARAIYKNGIHGTTAAGAVLVSGGAPAAAGFERIASAPGPVKAAAAIPYRQHQQRPQQQQGQRQPRIHPLAAMAFSSRNPSRHHSPGAQTPRDSQNGQLSGAVLAGGRQMQIPMPMDFTTVGRDREQPPPPLPMPQAYPNPNTDIWGHRRQSVDLPIAGGGDFWQRMQGQQPQEPPQPQAPQQQQQQQGSGRTGGASELCNLLGLGPRRR